MSGKEDALELVAIVAANRIELLHAGRIDIICAILGVSADRAKMIDLTDPYYMIAGIVLLAPNDATITRWDAIKVTRSAACRANSTTAP